MRIVIDCRCVFDGCGGIGNYAQELARAMARVDDEDEFLIIRTQGRPGAPLVKQPNFREMQVGAAMLDPCWEQLHLPLLLEEQGVDLYHNPTFSVPTIQPCLTVATIHDVVFRFRPDLVRESLRAYLDRWSEVAAHAATHLVTVSQFSKDTILGAYGLPEEKVTVIYEGVESERFHPRYGGWKETEFRKRFGIDGPYLLYVGALEPKKNIDGLLDAFRQAKKTAGLPHKLVLAGAGGGMGFDTQGAIEGFDLQKEVVVTGFLPEDLLPFAYNGADAFVYVSLYEGFGLPPLEAMACGVPTLVSDVTSLPEVVGKGALLVDPYDGEAMAQALARICLDQDLRHTLAAKGRARAGEFAWQSAALETLGLYRRLATAAREGVGDARLSPVL